jgi:hypothetical protein
MQFIFADRSSRGFATVSELAAELKRLVDRGVFPGHLLFDYSHGDVYKIRTGSELLRLQSERLDELIRGLFKPQSHYFKKPVDYVFEQISEELWDEATTSKLRLGFAKRRPVFTPDRLAIEFGLIEGHLGNLLAYDDRAGKATHVAFSNDVRKAVEAAKTDQDAWQLARYYFSIAEAKIITKPLAKKRSASSKSNLQKSL